MDASSCDQSVAGTGSCGKTTIGFLLSLVVVTLCKLSCGIVLVRVCKACLAKKHEKVKVEGNHKTHSVVEIQDRVH